MLLINGNVSGGLTTLSTYLGYLLAENDISDANVEDMLELQGP